MLVFPRVPSLPFRSAALGDGRRVGPLPPFGALAMACFRLHGVIESPRPDPARAVVFKGRRPLCLSTARESTRPRSGSRPLENRRSGMIRLWEGRPTSGRTTTMKRLCDTALKLDERSTNSHRMPSASRTLRDSAHRFRNESEGTRHGPFWPLRGRQANGVDWHRVMTFAIEKGR
jgi:hypothetical protein